MLKLSATSGYVSLVSSALILAALAAPAQAASPELASSPGVAAQPGPASAQLAPASATSAPVLAQASGDSAAPGDKHDFRPLTPARILDTRPSQGGTGIVSAFTTKRLQVTSQGGVPSTATSVVVNLTVTGAQGPGFLTAFPVGKIRPTASSLNFGRGDTTPNQAVVTLGTGGAINVYTHGTAHVIVDVLGYFEGSTANVPLTPTRLLDTRQSTPLAPFTSRKVKVAGRGGVPTAGMGAAIVNLTVTNAKSSGFLTAYPAGQARPTASNLNFQAGKNRAVMAVVPMSSTGEIEVYSHAGADVIVDVVGALRANPRFHRFTPRRVLDSRNDTGVIKRKIRAGETLTIDPGAPRWAFGAALNITAVNPTRAGFFTAYPSDASRPTASNVNYTQGAVANSAMVKLGADGKFRVFSLAETDIVIDVSGFFGGPVEYQLLDKVNKERRAVGLRELKMAPCLVDRMAKPWAKHLAGVAGDIYHQDVNKTFDVCSGFYSASENIARDQRTVPQVMHSWMTSKDGHKENILDPRATHFGAAEYNLNWVQNFGGTN